MDGPRACLADELPALLGAANRVFRPSGGDMGRAYPLLFSTANLANLRVISDGRDIIAHAGLCLRRAAIAGVGFGVGAVGAVFTRDDHRERGLASAVVGDALSRARTAGAALALVSGDGPLYRRLGFSSAPPAACWQCPKPLTRGDIAGITDIAVVACRPPRGEGGGQAEAEARQKGEGGREGEGEGDLEILARLNDAEPARFERPTADWRAIVDAATLFAWPARIFIVRQQGLPVAYLAVAQRARRRILEFAGDRAAILAAAPVVADELVVPWHDLETTARARALGWPETALPLGIASLWLEAPRRSLPLPWYGLNYV